MPTRTGESTREVTDGKGTRITFTKMSHIQPQPQEMLWEGRIPLGTVTILAGDPKVGKSFLTLTIAARVTTGKPWPDVDGDHPTGSAMLVLCEDNLSRTVVKRLIGVGADLDKIDVLTDLKIGYGKSGWFNLNEHLELLEKGLRDDTKVVIIDPISAFVGGSGLSSNTKTRALMDPIAKFAERNNLAVILVTHLTKSKNKKFMYRIIDSIGQVGTARSIWGVIKDESIKNRRLLLPVGGNLSAESELTGLGFRIIDGAVEFEPDVIEDPDRYFVSQPSRPTPKLDAAKTFLLETLADGPVWSVEIFNLGGDLNISVDTLRCAKDELGIKVYKVGNDSSGGWYWVLPEKDDDQSSTEDDNEDTCGCIS